MQIVVNFLKSHLLFYFFHGTYYLELSHLFIYLFTSCLLCQNVSSALVGTLPILITIVPQDPEQSNGYAIHSINAFESMGNGNKWIY